MPGIINKIRDQSALVASIIFISMILFVLSSVLSDRFSLFNHHENIAGEVNGEKIEYKTFNDQFQNVLTAQQNRQPAFDDNQKITLLNQVWDQAVNDKIFTSELANLKIEVPGSETHRLFVGPDPSPYITQIPDFHDPKTGQFDPQRVSQILAQSKTNEQLEKQLMPLEEQVVQARTREMYLNMLKAAVFVSDEEARRATVENQRSASIEYVGVNFGAIPDSSIKLTDADYKAYYDENKPRFKQAADETVIQYVIFSKSPSMADSAAVLKEMEALSEAFKGNPAKEDSTFAMAKSDKGEPAIFQNITQLPQEDQAKYEKAEVGSVTGPTLQGNIYRLVKLSAVKTDTLPAFKFRHILLLPKGGTAQDSLSAHQLADSLARIATEKNFAELAMQFSDDQRSKFSGGELGWIPRGVFGKEFETALAASPKGIIHRGLSSRGGFHVVDLEDRNSKLIRLATISREITASPATVAAAQAKAQKLSAALTSSAQFTEVASKQHLDVRTSGSLSAANMQLPGLNGSTELVKWALTGKQGDLSGVKETDDAFVVASILTKLSKGIKPLEAVKTEIEPFILNKKKTDLVLGRFANVPAGASLEAYQKAYGTAAFTNKAENITYSSATIPGIGNDAVVLGTIAAMKPNTTSKPVVGLTGVYVIKLLAVQQPGSIDPGLIKTTQKSILSARQNALQSKIFTGLKEYAKIEDYRYNFTF